jgi:hypothetical protein
MKICEREKRENVEVSRGSRVLEGLYGKRWSVWEEMEYIERDGGRRI